jgi:hypothetical protein
MLHIALLYRQVQQKAATLGSLVRLTLKLRCCADYCSKCWACSGAVALPMRYHLCEGQPKVLFAVFLEWMRHWLVFDFLDGLRVCHDWC